MGLFASGYAQREASWRDLAIVGAICLTVILLFGSLVGGCMANEINDNNNDVKKREICTERYGENRDMLYTCISGRKEPL